MLLGKSMPFGSFSQLNGNFYVKEIVFSSVYQDSAFEAADVHVAWTAWNILC